MLGFACTYRSITDYQSQYEDLAINSKTEGHALKNNTK